MSRAPLEAVLPWRHPFLMIDRMLDCAPHARIVTEKSVTADDSVVCSDESGGWFPAVLLLEGMGQSAALLFRMSYEEIPEDRLPMLGFLKASLHGSARPGDSIRFDVRAVKMTHSGGVFEACAMLGEELLAEAELAFAAVQPAEGAAD